MSAFCFPEYDVENPFLRENIQSRLMRYGGKHENCGGKVSRDNQTYFKKDVRNKKEVKNWGRLRTSPILFCFYGTNSTYMKSNE